MGMGVLVICLETMAGRDNYVIVGKGFAGALNLLTLLRARNERIEGHEIVYIAVAEPWFTRATGALGQWPALLKLPGFPCNFSKNVNPTEFLEASELANCLNNEIGRIPNPPGFTTVYGNVDSFQRLGVNYVLHVTETNGTKREVPAAKIDICIGTGGIRRWTGTIDPALEAEYAQTGVLNPTRRVVCGEDFLTGTFSSQRVFVYGDGPTAAWCVETALAQDSEVVWSGNDFSGAIVSSGRNDHLVNGFSRDYQESIYDWMTKPPFKSTHPKLRMLGKVMLASLQSKSKGATIDVGLTPATTLGFSFDRVAIAIGQESTTATLKNLLPGTDGRKYLLTSKFDRRFLGLHADNGKVRVLGRAAFMHDFADQVFRVARSNANPDRGPTPNDFSRTLCAQAKGDKNFVACAINIAEANGFYDAWWRRRWQRPNYNSAPHWALKGWFTSEKAVRERMRKRARTIDPLA
jgi:hypothetical protein